MKINKLIYIDKIKSSVGGMYTIQIRGNAQQNKSKSIREEYIVYWV